MRDSKSANVVTELSGSARRVVHWLRGLLGVPAMKECGKTRNIAATVIRAPSPPWIGA
jgi:hypothetical protein